MAAVARVHIVTLMQVPLRLSFRGMEPSEAVEARVRERAMRFDRFYDRITSCNVVIDAPHRHQHKGNLFEVRILLELPGREIAINREGRRDPAHEDVYVAIRDAFDAAERKIEDVERKRDHRA